MKTRMDIRNPFIDALDNSYFNTMVTSNYHDSALSATKDESFFLFNGF